MTKEQAIGHMITLPGDHWRSVDAIANQSGADRSTVIQKAIRIYQWAIWQKESDAIRNIKEPTL